MSDDVNGEVEIVVVTMQFDAVDDAGLLGVLSKYVVLARMMPCISERAASDASGRSGVSRAVAARLLADDLVPLAGASLRRG